MTDPTGSTGYAYDRRGLLLRESRTIASSDYATTFHYDEDGNRSRSVSPGGRITDSTFDYAGRPMSAVSGGTPIVTSASYLPFGPMSRMTLGNGTTRTMTFDERYRLATNVLGGPAGAIASYTYGHDAAGNVTSVHDALDAGYHRDYDYDDLNRLVGAGGGVSLWGNGAFSYDAMGNLRSSSLGAGTKTFTYEATTPKLVSVTEGGSRSVSYDAAGNEVMVGAMSSGYSPRNLLESTGLFRYRFDGRGIRTVAFMDGLAAVSLGVETTPGGVDLTGEVVLSEPAPAGGVVVQLFSDHAVAIVPESVEVPAGASGATFTVQVLPVTTSTIARITAVLGLSSRSATVIIEPGAAIEGLSFESGQLATGASTTGTVTLNASAPEGGVLVELFADQPALLTVPESVTVPEGEMTATFTASRQGPVPSVTEVVVTAEYESSELEEELTLLPPEVVSVMLTPSQVEGGTDVAAEVTLSAPAAEGTEVTFASSSESADAPGPLSVVAGATTGLATVRTELVEVEQTAVITALLEPTSASAPLTIRPLEVTLDTISVDLNPIVGSKRNVLRVTLTDPAPQAGLEVELVGGSGSPLELVPYVTVPAGQSEALISFLTTLETTLTSTTIRARHGLTARDAEVGIQPPPGRYVSSFTLAATRAATGQQVEGTLELSEAAPVGGAKVTLTSLPKGKATLPSSVTVPHNATTATFTVTGGTVIEPLDVKITATYNGLESREQLTVVPTAETVTLESVTVPTETLGGNEVTGTVVLSGPAPVGGAVVVLSGSRSGVATVPESVTVLEGESAAEFAIATHPVNYPRGVLLTGSYNHLIRQDVLVVQDGQQLGSAPTHAVGGASGLADTRTGPVLSRNTRARPASAGHSPETTGGTPSRRLYFYTPELNLLAESFLTSNTTPAIQYEYVWFGGQPVAQIETATGDVAWYFNDHLGTPVLQTDASADVVWRVEREPYGKVFSHRAGAARHQPLAFPGQEEQGAETSYNIFRWYRAGWGRYTQSDPLRGAVLRPYTYVDANPINWTDPLGLIKWKYYTHTTTHPMAFKNGCTDFKFNLGHGCKQIGCQYPSQKPAWKLEYVAEATFLVFINAASSASQAAKTLEHENEHIDTAIGNVLSGLATLLPFEKPTYSSEQECEDAAQKGLKALAVNANRGQAGVDDYVGYLVGKALRTKCP